ncbi:MAG: molecular chaperone DnaJ [Patescibacteria group bacterium]|nr:molecular chaperone DnaJ [Patescibacteria group bacterium]MDD5396367.1 molecular chaperone DnaJ [Patescibacteria group bacterium]
MADYYKTLGINKNASADEIRRAFRELAHKYHPDKAGGNAEKFKEVNEAYQTLSDAEKRKMYDQYGETFQQARSQGGFSGFDNFRDWATWAEAMKQNGHQTNQGFQGAEFGDLGDIFGDLFGGFSGGRTRARKKTGRDMEIEISVDFKEAVFGTEKELRLEKNATCQKCGGTGAEPGSKIINCSRCRGTGQVAQDQTTFFGTFRTVGECPECRGEGKLTSKKCVQCKGEGRYQQYQNIKVKIPAGVNDGGVIRLAGYGEAGAKSATAGDLYIHLHIRPDKYFKREGYNLYSQEQISISQAVLGGKINVRTIDGEVVLKIPAGTYSGQEFKLSGKGVPFLKGHGRGDQIVEVEIKVPKNLNKKQKDLFEKLQDENL